jgi:Cdc6-like AAA superfamily ATPase
MSLSQSIQRQLFRSAEPDRPLQVGDERYVECAAARGTVHLFDSLVSGLRFQEHHTTKLITGHRGCGKTTELLRVKDALEKGDPAFFCVYFEAEDYLSESLRDVGFPDLLMSIAASVWQDVKARTDRQLESGLFGTLLDSLKDIFGGFKVDSLTIGSGIASMKATFKENPTNRRLVRERLEADRSSVLMAVNEVLAQAREALRDKYADVVVIADNLDRIPRIQLANSPLTNQELLFVESWDDLSRLGCHAILTLPPEVCYG